MLNYRKKKIIIVAAGLFIILLSCIFPIQNKASQEESTIETSSEEELIVNEKVVDMKYDTVTAPLLVNDKVIEEFNIMAEMNNSYEESSEETVEPSSEEESTEPEVITVLEAFKIPKFSINSTSLSEELNKYLYTKLDENGIAWWHTIALCQAYQESKFNIYAEAPNGLDKGLFQFRKTFWAGVCKRYLGYVADIFDPYAQIDVYVGMVTSRLNSGLTQSQVISAHYTGGSGYSQKYVDQVMQWANKIIEE